MRNKLVADRYAHAILMNIDDSHFASFRQDIELLEKAFFKNPEYIKTIDSLLYPLKKRLALTEEIASKLANRKVWKNLFKILIIKHRFSIIGDILLELDHLILKKKNTIKVQLIVARKHSADTIQNIEERIKSILNRKVEFVVSIDPDLIGGFVAQTESILIDGSIRHNLVKFAKISKKQEMRAL